MTVVLDFHAHAFPDHVAERAVPALAESGGVAPHHDGRVASLLGAMDRTGVAASVICSIATRPGQFEPILAWSGEIRSQRIIPFPSVHPEDPDLLDHLARIREEGFLGIKMHPYYQGFALDEERLMPLYGQVERLGLVLVMHTGFDIAFPRDPIASPARIRTVIDRFPGLKLVATHMGAWQDWDQVEELLIGRPLFLDISFSLQFLDREQARRMILAHPEGYVLFGTDSPWADQAEVIALLRALDLGSRREEMILGENGCRLLGIDPETLDP